MNWSLKTFDELNPHELYAVMRLRIEVFIVEQNCVFQDADNWDQKAFHLMGFEEEELLAYTRLLPPDTIYSQPSIGRVVTSPAARKKGMGRELMERSIDSVYKIFGRQPIRIGAQLYLERFYSSLGFKRVSEVYLEDSIEHIYMVKN